MLNTQRVVILSLFTSLFFAAPLLCVQVVSIQLEKRQRLAVKESRFESLRVVKARNSCQHIGSRARAAAWARATGRFVATEPVLSLGGTEQVTNSCLLFDGRVRTWGAPPSKGTDATVAPGGTGDIEVTSTEVVDEMRLGP
jgi:hypothetical protein